MENNDFIIMERNKLLEERDSLHCTIHDLHHKILGLLMHQLQNEIHLLQNIILEENQDYDTDYDTDE